MTGTQATRAGRIAPAAAAAARAALGRGCPAVSLAVLLAVLLAVMTQVSGCRAGRSAPRLPDAGSVRALLSDAAVDQASASARGRAGVRLWVGEHDLPALAIAFSLREAGELGLVLRPGVLPPVLSLWAGANGWTLLLPREKTAFEVSHAPGLEGLVQPEPPAEPDAGPTLTGPSLARIAAWALGPHTLLADLADPEVRREGGEWIVTGRPSGLGGSDLRAELHLTAARGAISRWNLKSGGLTELVEVSYNPDREPGGLGRTGQRIHFVLPPVALAGTLTLDHIRAAVPDPRERPSVPDGWVGRPGTDLLPALARLQDDLGAGS
jgi:hypothetical protein